MVSFGPYAQVLPGANAGALQTRRITCPVIGEEEAQGEHHWHLTTRKRLRHQRVLLSAAAMPISIAVILFAVDCERKRSQSITAKPRVASERAERWRITLRLESVVGTTLREQGDRFRGRPQRRI